MMRKRSIPPPPATPPEDALAIPGRHPTQWIEAIGIVSFDLAVGQTVELLCPPLPLNPSQEAEVAFLCFPDANVVRDGHQDTHDFVFAFNQSECDGGRQGVRREQRSPERDSKRKDFGEDVSELFCTSLFRQREDRSMTRGAEQKALLVMSKVPLPGLFRDVLQVLKQLLDDESPDEKLQVALSDIRKWPELVPNTEYKMLPLCGNVLSCSTPSFDDTDLTPGRFTAASLDGFALNPVGLLQRDFDGEKAASFVGGDLEALKKQVSSGSTAATLQVNPHFQVVAKRVADAAREKEISTDALSLLNRELSTLVADAYHCLDGRAEMKSKGMSDVPPEERRFLFQDVEIHTALFAHITKLSKLWELMIIGEPVVVLGADASLTSAACLALPAMMAPLRFCGVLRPYVTINNREVDACMACPSGQAVCGATNPYFVKHCLQWPQFLCIADTTGSEQTHRMYPVDSEKREKQQFKIKNRMFCSRHFTVITDHDLGDDCVKTAPSDVLVSSDPDTSSVAIYHYFRGITEEFLSPIRVCVAELAADRSWIFEDVSTVSQRFSPSVITDRLRSSAIIPLHRFKSTKDAFETYGAFLKTRSCINYVNRELRRLMRETIIGADDVMVLLSYGPSDCMWSKMNRVQSWLRRELDRSFMDVFYIQKLAAFCSVIHCARNILAAERSSTK